MAQSLKAGEKNVIRQVINNPFVFSFFSVVDKNQYRHNARILFSVVESLDILISKYTLSLHIRGWILNKVSPYIHTHISSLHFWTCLHIKRSP